MKYFLFSVQIVGSHFQFLRWTVSVTTLFVFFVVCRIVNRKWYPSWTLSKLMKTNLLWYNNFIFFNVLHVYKSLSLINYWTVRWNIWMFSNLHRKIVIKGVKVVVIQYNFVGYVQISYWNGHTNKLLLWASFKILYLYCTNDRNAAILLLNCNCIATLSITCGSHQQNNKYMFNHLLSQTTWLYNMFTWQWVENELYSGSRSPHLGQGHDDSDQNIWITCIGLTWHTQYTFLSSLCCVVHTKKSI